MGGMPKAKPSSQAEPPLTPSERGKRGGNPLLQALKEGKQLPPGYYLDEKKRIRKVPAQAPVPVEGEFDRLRAMRWVLNNPPVLDSTEGHKACRAWLLKAPGPFMETYDELETAARGAAAGPTLEKAVEETESDEEVRQAILELLGRFRPT